MKVSDLIPKNLYKNNIEMTNIIDSEEKEFENNIKLDVENSFYDNFIKEATIKGIEKYEKLLNIKINGNENIEYRRQQVVTQLLATIPYTYKRLLEILDRLCEGYGYEISQDINNYIINLTTHFVSTSKLNSVLNLLKYIIPSNLKMIVNNVLPETLISGNIELTACVTNYEIVPISSKPKSRTMTAIIDLTNLNSETSVTYADGATDMTPGSDDWDEFFGHYPCLFKEGQEVGKLNRNNFAQFEDGTEADITSGNAGYVMIAFPRRGVKIETSEDGNTLTVSMTDNPNDDNFTYYAHTRGETRKEIFYLGAYKGRQMSNKLVSLSEKTPTYIKTLSEYRDLAHTNGDGYEQLAFYQLTYTQIMYILKYKNLNSQQEIGRGYVSGNSIKNTGFTNTKGMDWGTTETNSQVKIFGLEDYWGNMFEYVDGIITNSIKEILVTTDNFNDTGLNYIKIGQGDTTSNLQGYILKPQGTSELGFIIKKVNSKSTAHMQYFTDYGALISNSRTPIHGGSYDSSDINRGGIFALQLTVVSSSYEATARLMYL